MFCGNCGRELPDNAKFCSGCGAMITPDMAGPAAIHEEPDPMPPRVEEVPKKGTKKKKHETHVKKGRARLIIGICAAVVIIAAGVTAGVFLLGGNGGSGSTEAAAVSAWMDEEGTSYIALADGTVKEISGDISGAWYTADRKNIVVLQEGGTLSQVDPALENWTEIDRDVCSVRAVRDSGVIYAAAADSGDYIYYRYLFDEADSVKLGEISSISVADNTLSVIFLTDDDRVCILPEEASDYEKAASAEDGAYVYGISDDGSVAVWEEYGDSDCRMRCYTDGETETLGTCSSGAYYTAWFSGNSFVLMGNPFFFRLDGQEGQKANLGDDVASFGAYTENGRVIYAENLSAKTDGFYEAVSDYSDDDHYSTFWIDSTGDKEKILPGIVVAAGNGVLAYLDEDDTLYYTKANGEDTEEGEKISDDVHGGIRISSDGKYIYYIKDYDSDHGGTLCVYDVKKAESTKIASDIYYSNYLSEDGKTVYYWKDPEDTSDGSTIGVLYSCAIGRDPVKIAGDVIVDSLASNRTDGWLGSSFTFRKYEASSDYSIYRYDGKDAERLVSSVCSTYYVW